MTILERNQQRTSPRSSLRTPVINEVVRKLGEDEMAPPAIPLCGGRDLPPASVRPRTPRSKPVALQEECF
jgi:hypothetical protein